MGSVKHVDFNGIDLRIELPEGDEAQVIGYIVRGPNGIELLARIEEDADEIVAAIHDG